MKFIVLAFLLTGLMYSPLFAQNSHLFTLDVSHKGNKIQVLYLRYLYKNKKIIDSSKIKDGFFVFQGNLEEPTKAELSDNKNLFNETNKNYISNFYIEPSNMNMSIVENNLGNSLLQGSKTNEDYKSYYNELNPVLNKISWIQSEIDSSKEARTFLIDSLTFYKKKSKQISLDFIITHKNSLIAVKAIQELIFSYEKEGSDSSIILLNSLNTEVQNYPTTQMIKQNLNNAHNSVIGHLATDFTRIDLNGKTIKLSSYKGKYVLLDFWASWCLPCRELSPHLKEVYKKYSKKGFVIISISCDSKYEEWINAIKLDNIQSFINILSFTKSDMNFLKTNDKIGDASWIGELRKQFNLMPIPVEILINKEGIILGRYGPTEKQPLKMLDQKLSEIFD